MKTGKKLNIISRCFLFIFIFLISSTASFAAGNLISGINVEQFGNNGYKVLLKLNKNTQIKKSFDSQDNLILVLNSTLPSDSMEIIYDNAVDLNNIIVQKKNADNTLILIQGKNIENSKIYTKELSTGTVKQIDAENNFINNLFLAADKKALGISLTGIIFLMFLMRTSRPKKKRNHINNNKAAKSVRNSYANTLRNKNMVQSRNIPSIGYKVNGSFNSANAYITTPKDMVSSNNSHYYEDNQYYEEEQIRKAG